MSEWRLDAPFRYAKAVFMAVATILCCPPLLHRKRRTMNPACALQAWNGVPLRGWGTEQIPEELSRSPTRSGQRHSEIGLLISLGRRTLRACGQTFRPANLANLYRAPHTSRP